MKLVSKYLIAGILIVSLIGMTSVNTPVAQSQRSAQQPQQSTNMQSAMSTPE